MPITFLYEQPRKFYFRKAFKRKIYNDTKTLSPGASEVGFGFYGLQALESARLKYRQVEAVRKAFLFFFKYKTSLVLRFHFNAPVTSKSAGVRMGRGKGKISH
jgi:large subunit ribosomal protein L16